MAARDGEERSAILLVDHGSRREEANALLDAVAAAVSERLPGRTVRTAHLEGPEPTIEQGVDACGAAGAREIAVVPYFLGPGRHTTEDIPRQVGDAVARHPGVRSSVRPPLGLHPKLVDVLLDRLDEAGPDD